MQTARKESVKNTAKILVLGQTPPPFGGQSINIAKMLVVMKEHNFDFRYIRMNFSDEMRDMGSASSKKAWRLLLLLAKVAWSLVIYRPRYVYYPPAGPDKNPVIRDMILLFPVRLFRFKVIFHYHAGGVSTIEHAFNGVLHWLYKFTYYKADSSICLSTSGTSDPQNLQSGNITIIPSGVPDMGVNKRGHGKPVNIILFAGVCRESKGLADFIEVIRKCRSRNQSVNGVVIGSIFSEKEQVLIDTAVKDGIIEYLGLKTGEEKVEVFRQADILLFPSFFASENFPTVILEAFSFGIPVISTNWRGIPDLVRPGINGFLHDVHDIDGMAASIGQLASDQILYERMSANARSDFESNYTLPNFDRSIAAFFNSL